MVFLQILPSPQLPQPFRAHLLRAKHLASCTGEQTKPLPSRSSQASLNAVRQGSGAAMNHTARLCKVSSPEGKAAPVPPSSAFHSTPVQGIQLGVEVTQHLDRSMLPSLHFRRRGTFPGTCKRPERQEMHSGGVGVGVGWDSSWSWMSCRWEITSPESSSGVTLSHREALCPSTHPNPGVPRTPILSSASLCLGITM